MRTIKRIKNTRTVLIASTRVILIIYVLYIIIQALVVDMKNTNIQYGTVTLWVSIVVFCMVAFTLISDLFLQMIQEKLENKSKKDFFN